MANIQSHTYARTPLTTSYILYPLILSADVTERLFAQTTSAQIHALTSTHKRTHTHTHTLHPPIVSAGVTEGLFVRTTHAKTHTLTHTHIPLTPSHHVRQSDDEPVCADHTCKNPHTHKHKHPFPPFHRVHWSDGEPVHTDRTRTHTHPLIIFAGVTESLFTQTTHKLHTHAPTSTHTHIHTHTRTHTPSHPLIMFAGVTESLFAQTTHTCTQIHIHTCTHTPCHPLIMFAGVTESLFAQTTHTCTHIHTHTHARTHTLSPSHHVCRCDREPICADQCHPRALRPRGPNDQCAAKECGGTRANCCDLKAWGAVWSLVGGAAGVWGAARQHGVCVCVCVCVCVVCVVCVCVSVCVCERESVCV